MLLGRIKDLLEKSLRKEEEIGALQERITALETDSYNRKEVTEERSSKYKEILGSLQQHLEDSKRRLEDFRDKKTGADISAIQSASSNWRSNTSFMSSSSLSNSGSLMKSTSHLDLNATRKGAISMTVNGMKLQTEDKY